MLTVIIADGKKKKGFLLLSLSFKNAVKIMEVLSEKGDDDDFHTCDKKGNKQSLL